MNTSIICGIALATASLACAADEEQPPNAAFPAIRKGALVVEDQFDGARPTKKWMTFAGKWRRRATFGDWQPLSGGGLRAANIPDDGHGPVLVYEGRFKDLVIECEFRLPAERGPFQHFRVFLNHPDYSGHTIGAWANLSSKFQPVGLTLLHNPKTEDKKVIDEKRFGPAELKLEPDRWYAMRLELFGRHARVTVDGVVVSGSHPGFAVEKNVLGLNPGRGNGDVRNFRVWEALEE